MIRLLRSHRSALRWIVALLSLAAVGASAAELTYTDNLLAWYKADAGMFTEATGNTPSSNGDPVGRWEDQSGNGYHLRRITGSERPLVDTGAGPLSSSALHFDGDDYLLMSSGGIEASAIFFPPGTELGTVFMVFRPNSEITSSSAHQMLLSASAISVANSVMLGGTTGSLTDEVITLRDVAWSAASTVWRNQATGMTGGYTIPNNEYTFLSLTHAGNTFEIRTSLGGADLTSQVETAPGPDGWTDFNDHGSTVASPAYQTTLRVGGIVESGIARFDGYISEIIVYGAVLNATERAQVENYLDEKYVTGPPPGTVLMFGKLQR